MKKYIFIFIFILLSRLSIADNYISDVRSTTKKYNATVSTKNVYFDHLPLQENTFAIITIDGIIISPPKTIQEISKYLDEIKNNLINTNKKIATFKYGDMRELKLKLPYLNEGDQSFIFEILESNITTNKILKLNIKGNLISLNAGKKENYNYNFWQQQANKHNFTVTKMYECHPFGLYSIKEKNNGISLTKALMNKNLIFITDVTNNATEYKKITNTELKEPQINKISTVIDELLYIIKTYPNHSVSISPNNIFIDLETTTNIKAIELVDYGTADTKIESYAKIKEFNQYLEYAAERLSKYLQLNYKI